MKKTLALFLALAQLLLLCACGETSESENAQNAFAVPAENKTVFSAENVVIQDKDVDIVGAKKAGDAVILYAEGESASVFYRLDASTHEVQKICEMDLGHIESVDCLCDGTAVINSMSEQGNNLVTTLHTGGEVEALELPLPESLQSSALLDVRAAGDNCFFVRDYAGGYLLSAAGEMIKKYDTFSEYTELVRAADDTLYIIEGGHTAYRVNDDYSLGEGEKLPVKCALMYDGGKADALLGFSDSFIVSVNPADGTFETLANTDINIAMSNEFVYLAENEYLSLKNGAPVVWRPRAADEVTVLTLATCSGINFFTDDQIQQAVAKFNSMETGCVIEIKDYASYDNAGGDGAMLKFNADIASGNYPDIYDVWSLESPNFARNGLVEDLLPYMTADSDIALENYFTSIFDTFKQDGKLYDLVPSFRLTTVYTYKDNPNNWETIAATPDPKKVFGNINRDDFLAMALVYSGDEFVSMKNGTCNFNSGKFAQVLEFAKHLTGATSNDLNFSAVYNGEQQYLLFSSNNLVEEWQQADAAFHNNVKAVQFPIRSSYGECISPDLRLAMSAQSTKKEAVWQFFKYLLGDSYQWYTPNIPVNKEIFGAIIENEMKLRQDPKYGLSVFVKDGDSYIDVGLELEAPPATLKEDLIERINHVDCVNQYDDTVLNIVLQEAERFFSGVKDAPAVADTIQSRVSIYLAEQYK